MVLRILQAFFISPGISMGQAVVAESFFAHQRAQKMVRRPYDDDIWHVY
jgi:hypothetical protein